MRRFLEGKAFRATGFEKNRWFLIFLENLLSLLFYILRFFLLPFFYKHVPVEHAKNEVPGNGDFASL